MNTTSLINQGALVHVDAFLPATCVLLTRIVSITASIPVVFYKAATLINPALLHPLPLNLHPLVVKLRPTFLLHQSFHYRSWTARITKSQQVPKDPFFHQ